MVDDDDSKKWFLGPWQARGQKTPGGFPFFIRIFKSWKPPTIALKIVIKGGTPTPHPRTVGSFQWKSTHKTFCLLGSKIKNLGVFEHSAARLDQCKAWKCSKLTSTFVTFDPKFNSEILLWNLLCKTVKKCSFKIK